MDEDVRKELKSFDDVLVLLNDMIRNIDGLLQAMDLDQEEKSSSTEKDNLTEPPEG